MKIGIITQPLSNNYGGLLQNYALQQILIRLGHSPMTIDQPAFLPAWSFYAFLSDAITIFKNIIKVFFPNKQKGKLLRKLRLEEKTKGIRIRSFVENRIITTPKLFSSKSIREECRRQGFDVYIVGSDQVWRPRYNLQQDNAFLSFTDNWKVKRIAYAASFGTDKWEFSKRQTIKYRELLQKFNKVSVREKSAISLCKEYFHINTFTVLDPTMLLDTSDYIKLAGKETDSDGNLFVYLLSPNPEKYSIVDSIEQRLSLTQFYVWPQRFEANEILPSVEKWIKSFIDAEFVICDSFHGAVFSILFNKEFILLPNDLRGNTRFETLLETFKLEERLLANKNNLLNVLQNKICWDEVNEILKKERQLSLYYLKSSIEQ